MEPQPACIEQSRKFFARSDVTIVARGLAPPWHPHTLRLSARRCPLRLLGLREDGKVPQLRVGPPVGTLHDLVRQFGVHDFCKIDVEGFEYEVLRGLNCPLPALSFELTREFLDDARRCIGLLEELGMSRFNFVSGEGSEFALPAWPRAPTCWRACGPAVIVHFGATSSLCVLAELPRHPRSASRKKTPSTCTRRPVRGSA